MALRKAEAMIRKRYLAAGQRQIHARESGWNAGGTPLVCLHATAYSSRQFDPLMRAFGDNRHVLAIDLPGYGDSDPPAVTPNISCYARMIGEAIETPRVDLFGYHTGVAIAAELALLLPRRVGQLTFMGIPHFRALNFEQWKARLCTAHLLEPSLDQFAERWAYLVSDRPQGLSLRRGFENFVDELKAWPDGARAHRALFAYDLEESLARLTQSVTVLNPAGHLAEASRIAAGLIPRVRLIELPELAGAALECEAVALAALIPSAAGSVR
ncbi:alpha/beta fold hydrolase [Novosphingobium sp. Gsoil 351]|uniref:alpha/beta fold hydrolase n=1 Tax=Novosphingobium sp. Gsoil 351 TaxID=2675225 RepID=UPI0012B4F74A|nr:alpha/beta hydrolase [Novosphingobium sp. Gsoil 351]QGN55878.1 alpha/beta fold hydrolase [Novosphingobium sp. Gsoil 351]